MEKQIYIDNLAKLFLGTDERSEKLMHMQYENGKVIATNAHAMIVIPERYIKDLPPFYEQWVKWDVVIPKHEREGVLGRLSIEELDRAERLTPKEPVYDECETCQGNGVWQCKCCDSDVDCKDCNGDGIGDKIIIHEVNYSHHAGKIGDATFNLNYIFSMLKVAQFLNKPIELIINSPTSANIFYIDDILILVMPTIKDPDNMPDNIIPFTLTPPNNA